MGFFLLFFLYICLRTFIEYCYEKVIAFILTLGRLQATSIH